MKKVIYLIAIMLVAAISVSAQAPIRHNAMQKPSAEQIAKQRAERMRKELALDNSQYNKVYKIYFKQAKEQAKNPKINIMYVFPIRRNDEHSQHSDKSSNTEYSLFCQKIPNTLKQCNTPCFQNM
mgnify:CR=1 FL=1